MNQELATAVRLGAKAHAEQFAREHCGGARSECGHLLDALNESPVGINPKIRIALASIVKHVMDLDRRVERLEVL